MTTAALAARAIPRARSAAVLTAAARLWLAAVAAGEALFLAYILAFYYPATFGGHFEAWRRNSNLLTGYRPGDAVGNLSFAVHVVLAGVVTFAGVTQLLPGVRARAPAVHRWLGRIYVSSAIGAALVGVYGVWVRGGGQDLANAVAITLNAALILATGAQAWRLALRRDFAGHRRWALRAFLVVNGVFFLRLGMVVYGLASHLAGPGVLPRMGQAFDVWTFGSYLAPLAVLELYLRAEARGRAADRVGLAAVLVVLAALTAVGGVGAWFGLYAPLLARV